MKVVTKVGKHASSQLRMLKILTLKVIVPENNAWDLSVHLILKYSALTSLTKTTLLKAFLVLDEVKTPKLPVTDSF